MNSETLQESGADLALFARRHPWLTTMTVIIAGCAVVFFCLEWRAEQRWQRYAAEARAHGVKLMLTDFAQPEIPDAQNFAALPMMRKLFTEPEGAKPFHLPQAKSGGADNLQFPKGNAPPSYGDPTKGPNIDLAIWQDYFQAAGFLAEKSSAPAHGVLQALDHFAPEFREWSEWRTRSQCHFPLVLTNPLGMHLPHVDPAHAAAKMFTLRMRAHLAVADSGAAYTDFQDALQAYRMFREEPLLVIGLVRIAILRTVLDGVGDGLKNRSWGPAELEKIQGDLAAIHLIDDWRFALASERGSFNTTVELWLNASIRERGRIIAKYFGDPAPERSIELMFQLYPRMLFRDNQLRQNRYFDELLARVDATNQTVNLDSPTPSFGNATVGTYERLYYFLFFLSVPVYTTAESRVISLKTFLDEARIACALERFRAKHGAYPEELTELAPEVLAVIPSDLYAHAPLRYHRLGETSFHLYGVGENRTDEGGQIAPGVPERKQLDAVWPYAPSPAP